MASYEPVIKNGASGAIFYVALKPRTADGHFVTNPTLASGDVKISIDGGAFANLATLPDVEPNAGSAVRVILSQAETNGDNLVIQFIDAAGDEWNDLQVNIQTAAVNFDTIPTAVQNADTLLDRNMATGADSGSDTVRTARQALRFLRNKWDNAAGALTVKKEDDATTSWTASVSSDAAADPVTGIDPAS